MPPSPESICIVKALLAIELLCTLPFGGMIVAQHVSVSMHPSSKSPRVEQRCVNLPP